MHGDSSARQNESVCFLFPRNPMIRKRPWKKFLTLAAYDALSAVDFLAHRSLTAHVRGPPFRWRLLVGLLPELIPRLGIA